MGCEELVEYVRCAWLGAAWVESECWNRGSVGRVCILVAVV